MTWIKNCGVRNCRRPMSHSRPRKLYDAIKTKHFLKNVQQKSTNLARDHTQGSSRILDLKS